MPASKTYGIDAQIKGEVHKAMVSLGAGSKDLSLIAQPMPQTELYETLQRLGAKSDLLSIIGSWGDTMDDEWVLSALLEWNGRVRPISGRLTNCYHMLGCSWQRKPGTLGEGAWRLSNETRQILEALPATEFDFQ